jgi:anti-sigma regulatory factor (Ser/Thr protein kinase)
MGERTGHGARRGEARTDSGEPASPAAGGFRPAQVPLPPGSAPVFLSELAGPDLVVVSATRGAGTALAGRDASLIGFRLADVVRGPSGQHLIEVLRGVHATGRHARNVLWRAQGAGHQDEAARGVFSVSAVPVRRSDGSAGGVVVAGLGLSSQPSGMPGPGRSAGLTAAHSQPRPGQAEKGNAMPPGLPILPGVRLAARSVSAGIGGWVGGSWLDAVMLPHGVIALMVGIMSGGGGRPLGLPGVAGHLRTALREMLLAGAEPAEALAGFDDLAPESARRGGAGACLAQLDPARGEVSYASAGHLMPLLCTPAGEAVFLPPPGSEPLGGDGHPGAPAVVLPPGGVLLLCPGRQDEAALTDGRLADLAASVVTSSGSPAAPDMADRVCAAAAQWLARGHRAEAMALAVHRLPEPAADWSMEFPADPQALTGLRPGLRGWLDDLGADSAGKADVELAVWEAAVNAAVHGRPSQGAGAVSVQAGLDGAGNALIRVTDEGRWQLVDSGDSGRGLAGGRGLSVISQVTDEVSIAPSPAGTTVMMRRRLRHPVSVSPAPT